GVLRVPRRQLLRHVRFGGLQRRRRRRYRRGHRGVLQGSGRRKLLTAAPNRKDPFMNLPAPARRAIGAALFLAAPALAQTCTPDWTTPASGGTNDVVYAMTVFNGGDGPVLYVGGNFGTAGGAPASRVAKWNGTAWSNLGSGVNSTVYAMCTFNDGTGE